eukprot:11149152-Ditylum_brightwellii.AAC.1
MSDSSSSDINSSHKTDSDDDAMNDDNPNDGSIKDGVFIYHQATIEQSLKNIFLQCKQFNNLSFSASGLGIDTFL